MTTDGTVSNENKFTTQQQIALSLVDNSTTQQQMALNSLVSKSQ